jgi:exonuclease SbcC
MRPIELTLKGLHSFREKQTVDFSRLCDGGVFGIFGPTGSGKSTLLDAMTLALYGKVERAPGGTQGILNHAEDELSVSYTFELGMDQPKRYRVERIYKRTKTDGLNNAGSRLLHFEGDAPKVLADKDRDVTRKIQALLGLTHEDFTRAVVLPQGKFAEFLSLKGSERRHMLERLFNLEKYGDRLNDVIRRRTGEVRTQLEAIRSAQLELGDASAEALEAAKQAYLEKDALVQQLTERYQVMKDRCERAERLRGWQADLEKALERQQALSEKTGRIDALRKQIEKARVAVSLLPYVTEYEAISEKLASCRTEKEIAESHYKASVLAEEESSRQYKEIEQRLTENRPNFEERRHRLQEAIKIHEDFVQKVETYESLKKEWQNLQSVIQEHSKQNEVLASEYETLSGKRSELREALKAVTVTVGERDKVECALKDKQTINNHVKALADLEKEIQQLENERKEQTEKAEKDQKTLGQSVDRLKRLFTRYESCYTHVSALKKGLDMVLDWLDQKEAVCDKRIQDLTIQHLASELAKGLIEGNPCPVCGAIHHPHPATAEEEGALQTVKSELQFYKSCSQWVSKALSSCTSYQAHLEQRVQAIQQLDGGLVPAPSGRKEHALPDLSTWAEADLKAWMTETKADLQGIKQDVLALDEELKLEMDRFKQLSDQCLVLQTKKEALEKQLALLLQRRQETEAEIDHSRKKWAVAHAPLDFNTIEDESDRIRVKDRKAHELSQEIESLTQRIEDMEQAMRKRSEQLSTWQQDNVRLEVNLKEVGQQMTLLKTSYENIMNGDDREAGDVLREWEEEWEILQREEAEKRKGWEQAKSERFEAEKRLSQLEGLLKSLNEQAEEKGKALLAALKEKAFPSPQAVKEACLSETVLLEKEQVVQNFQQEWHQVHHEIKDLKAKIGDSAISEREFKDLVQAFEQLADERDQALEARATCLNQWKGLEERHERYVMLEKERADLSQTEADLQKLAHVFRGNAFVEFMAEEQMEQISRDASERLRKLTRGRYAIEVDSGGGFLIRDDANGGLRRPVSSLSGGETFLTSLALALSLSAQIQLRGEVPLQFFFLDEGFGTLDPELLDTVITALEKLHSERLSIGVISHVPELQERLARKLFVLPAEPSGRGSRIQLALNG